MLSRLVSRKRSNGTLTPPRATIQRSRSQCVGLRYDETHSPIHSLKIVLPTVNSGPARRVGRRTEGQRIALPAYTASLKVKVKVLDFVKRGGRRFTVIP